jgi:cell division protease FtsH
MWQTLWRPLLVILVLVFFFNVFYGSMSQRFSEGAAEIPYSRFKDELARDNVKEITIKGSVMSGEFRTGILVAGS